MLNRSVIEDKRFEDNKKIISVDPKITDDVLLMVTWYISREPNEVGVATEDPLVRAIKVRANNNYVIYYTCGDQEVILLDIIPA